MCMILFRDWVRYRSETWYMYTSSWKGVFLFTVAEAYCNKCFVLKIIDRYRKLSCVHLVS